MSVYHEHGTSNAIFLSAAFTAHAQDPAAPVWSETLEDRLSVTGVQEDVTTGKESVLSASVKSCFYVVTSAEISTYNWIAYTREKSRCCFDMLGTLLGTLLAVDPQGQTVTYSTTSSVVAVDSGSGNVRLQQALDMEVSDV